MKSGFALKLAIAASMIGSAGCASTPKQPASATQESAQNIQTSDAADAHHQTSTTESDATDVRDDTNTTETIDSPASDMTSDSTPLSADHPTVMVQPDGSIVSEQDHISNAQTTERSEIQQRIDAGDFVSARKLALDNYKSGQSDDTDFWAAVEADPLLNETLEETVKPHGTNTLSALGGGSTVSFKYQDSADASAKAAIKPDQDLRQTMYRSGIAYYRLCQILGCSFDTPVTRPVKWKKDDFNTLYNASTSPKNGPYRSKFDHLIWAKENGQRILYAGYKEWIPSFIGFPIEVTSAWSIYQRPGTTKYPDLRTFYKHILVGGRPNAINDINKLLDYSQNLTTRDILKQLSDITLVDYLTNNWDRYSGAQDNYGANCHFQPGGIIAIDNDAAFPAWHAPRVVKRLNLVQTFSRELVDNLRLLDPDKLLSHLIPNPTKEELRSYERFKERRRDALKYIDGLIMKYGEDKVLVY